MSLKSWVKYENPIFTFLLKFHNRREWGKRDMSSYKIDSRGGETERIQGRLKELGFYKGPIDGDFGGGTESAAKAFQKKKRLDVDCAVGPITWNALFKEEISEPSIILKRLNYECLALTVSFETGKAIHDCFAGLSGDFDGQGISLGVLGQDSLQPLLREMMNKYPKAAKAEWIEDVRTRKVYGGRVAHGINYDLEGQFGVRLVKNE